MEKERFPDLERRKLPRFKDNMFIVCFLRASPHIKLKAITCDISAGGLMFETERKISKEKELELEIYQPINCGKSTIRCVPVLAKVIWVEKIEKENFEQGENKYRVGVEFPGIKEEDRELITRYVDNRTKHIS
ncbi:MAG: PilZ domain-containing protein [Candidatus Omnitrophota bacterium]